MLTSRLARLTANRRSVRYLGRPYATKPHAQEFKVVLENKTLYIGRSLAEALGWKPAEGERPVSLTLHGSSPKFFAIAKTGTDSELLARKTVESFKDPRMQEALEYLRDR